MPRCRCKLRELWKGLAFGGYYFTCFTQHGGGKRNSSSLICFWNHVIQHFYVFLGCMEEFGAKRVYSSNTNIGRDLLQIVSKVYHLLPLLLKLRKFCTFILYDPWTLHVYVTLLGVNVFKLFLWKSTNIHSCSFVEKQNLILRCHFKTQSIFAITLHDITMTVKSMQHMQLNLRLDAWWNQISRLERWRLECYSFTRVSVTISFCLPLLTHRQQHQEQQ